MIIIIFFTILIIIIEWCQQTQHAVNSVAANRAHKEFKVWELILFSGLFELARNS